MRRAVGRMRAWVVGGAVGALGAALAAWGLRTDGTWAERHSLPSYCATDPVERTLARSLGGIACALGVLLAAVLAPALARAARRWSIRGRAGAIAAVCAALACSLFVTELWMRRHFERLTLAARLTVPVAGSSPIARADPRLGWSYVPRRTTWVRVDDRVVPYTIDADGDRSASVDDAPDPHAPTVLFAGESIAFGHGLRHEETIPVLAGRALHLQAINLAVAGYGSDQAHLRVLDTLPRFPGTVAVVSVFVPAQIRRNVETWRPRLALGPDGALDLLPPSSGLRIARLLQALPYHGDGALRVTAAVLRATAQAARERGAAPLFLVTNYGRPCLREEGEEPFVVKELFVKQGLPFVRVDLESEDLLDGAFEWHPNPRGAAKLAGAVVKALQKQLAEAGAAAVLRP
ncbi:MAG TPA: hypothetical protein VFP65_29730 [Anaeromyxobacteraceae bacterium]|nr:hypothetical protein [Anaeromyxobacteraceae bacterium]